MWTVEFQALAPPRSFSLQRQHQLIHHQLKQQQQQRHSLLQQQSPPPNPGCFNAWGDRQCEQVCRKHLCLGKFILSLSCLSKILHWPDTAVSVTAYYKIMTKSFFSVIMLSWRVKEPSTFCTSKFRFICFIIQSSVDFSRILVQISRSGLCSSDPRLTSAFCRAAWWTDDLFPHLEIRIYRYFIEFKVLPAVAPCACPSQAAGT